MPKMLEWDAVGEKKYETGCKRGVLYVLDTDAVDKTKIYPKGVVWNGLTNVNESPSGAEETPLYADDIKYASLFSAEEFGATVEAYTYPDEFAECDGSKEITTGVFAGQQERKAFGISYTTTIGNDVKGTSYGEKIHLVYGAKATPSEQSHQTINDSPDAGSFSWELKTTPVNVTGAKPTAHLTIDSTKVSAAAFEAIKKVLYGSDDADARMPLPDEVKSIIDSAATAGNLG